jgi:HAD superfamily hydrolase (TIGR01509 family)
MKRIRGVLLDVDGTLVDSNDAHARSWVEVFRRHGLEVSYERVRRLIGMGADKLLPEAVGIREDSPEGQRLVRERSELFLREELPKLRPCRGARDLVARLRAEGLKLVVASSAKDEELQSLLRAAGVEDLLREKTSSDDAERSKPDPDIVEAAIRKSGLPKEALVMIGDTPYDVEAARRAGIDVVAVRCGGWTDADLAGAAAVYDDPADLLARLDESPLAR